MQEVFVPDIGDFKSVDVVEILVKPGDTVAVEQSLVTLESDKATMEIPSPSAGVVKEVRVKVGDKVSEGSAILVLEAAEAAKAAAAAADAKRAPSPAASAPAALPRRSLARRSPARRLPRRLRRPYPPWPAVRARSRCPTSGISRAST